MYLKASKKALRSDGPEGVSPRRGQEVLGGLREGLQVRAGRRRGLGLRLGDCLAQGVDMMADHRAVGPDDQKCHVVEADRALGDVGMLCEVCQRDHLTARSAFPAARV